MPRTLLAAAIQLDAAPAPLENRLQRAEKLITQAAQAGAKLVVLPELFNTGYEYSDDNYARTEPLNGETVTWMKNLAQQHGIHLAGTLMILDEEDIYNAALLFAPSGKMWRYNKQYPWAMERAYFRGDDSLTIAETDFGKLGMMICWDSAHADLWRRYAGKVDALLVMSCPPKISSADLVFPDGLRVNMRELGGVFDRTYTEEEYFPGQDMDDQAAWLGVPVVATVGGGKISTKLPLPYLSVMSYLATRLDLWGRILQAPEVKLEAGFDRQTKVINAGEVVSRVDESGDGFTLGEITLADETPRPQTEQPKMRTHILAYFLSDVFAPALVTLQYRQRVRKLWGDQMAPLHPSTRVWSGALVGVLVVGIFLGRWLAQSGKAVLLEEENPA